MKLISEISNQPSERRKKFWLETLALPIQWQEISENENQDPALLLKSPTLDGVLVSTEFSSLFYGLSAKIPAEVVEVGMVDSLVREQKGIWIRCFLRQALRKLIFEKTPQLDTHANVYVAGSDSLARLCAVVAVQMGFRKLVIIAKNREEAAGTFENLQKLFFDLEIKILAETELTLQPNNGSLLLNTLNPESGGDVFEEMTFLNFIKKDGLVVDLCFSEEHSGTNLLIEEANHVGMKVIAGPGVWGLRDYLFLQAILQSELKISQTQYLQAWEALFPQ